MGTYIASRMDNPVINRIYNRLKDLDRSILVKLEKQFSVLEGILSP